MNHSPEPWTIAKRRGEKNVVDVVSKAEPHIQIIVANREDAERIVACVNACEGIPTETLVALATGGTITFGSRIVEPRSITITNYLPAQIDQTKQNVENIETKKI